MKAVYLFIATQIIIQISAIDSASADGVVCHYDSTDIEIKRNLTAVIKVYRDFEITSEEGSAYAEFAVPVNDYIEFSDLKGHTILPGGKKIKIDKRDYAILTGRMDREFGGKKAVLVTLKSPVVGARLHYEYRLDIKNLLYLPRIVRNNSYAVERMAVRLRWKGKAKINYDYSGFETTGEGREALFYVDNLPEIHIEPAGCDDNLYLYLSADRFKFDGKKFECDSWSDVGLFFERISRQPNSAMARTGELAERLLAGQQSLPESLKVLFDFVADSVSYVALRVGSGDFTPHNCGQIIERRFGDCKDQSVLLSSLYNAAGIKAYPALISTNDFPSPETLHPWPSFFDHAIVVVRTGGDVFILDPSDPYSDIYNIPPRLRGRDYLVVDGISGLETVPRAPDPVEGLSWLFIVQSDSQEARIDFDIDFINDSAVRFGRNFGELGGYRKDNAVRTILSDGGWKIDGLYTESSRTAPDTFSIMGEFYSEYQEADSLAGFPVGSPLVSYLIDNIFNNVRQTPYCRKNSIHLEELARLQDMNIDPRDLSEYRDYWIREGLEFYDEMKYIGEDIVFRRVFDLDGREISSEDYNAFRNFLLSRKNQRYVYLQN